MLGTHISYQVGFLTFAVVLMDFRIKNRLFQGLRSPWRERKSPVVGRQSVRSFRKQCCKVSVVNHTFQVTILSKTWKTWANASFSHSKTIEVHGGAFFIYLRQVAFKRWENLRWHHSCVLFSVENSKTRKTATVQKSHSHATLLCLQKPVVQLFPVKSVKRHSFHSQRQ